MPAPIELAIEGGTVVTPDGDRRATVYVESGRIVDVTDRSLAAERRIDADGLHVAPGFVDAHVHLMDPGALEREDWEHGTAAAAASGVTTVLEHTHFDPVLTADDLIAKREHATVRARVDFGLAAHVFPDTLDEIRPLRAAGACFLKVFTCTTHGVPGLDSAALLRALRSAAAANAIVLAHCEDQAILDMEEARLRAHHRADGGLVPEWRSREAELVATAQVVTLAGLTGARTVIAHASNPAVLEVIEAAQRSGTHVSGETCPQYLVLLEGEVAQEGQLRKFTPPARARSPEDLAEMWAAVRAGRGVDYVASDHAPSTRPQKTAEDIWSAPFGLPGLDTTSSILIDAAVRGDISFQRLGELYAEAPATLYGLTPRKGRIAAGYDADLVLIDPGSRRTVSASAVRSKAGWSPYEGREVRGHIVATYLRGRQVFADGEVVADPGQGVPIRPSGDGA